MVIDDQLIYYVIFLFLLMFIGFLYGYHVKSKPNDETIARLDNGFLLGWLSLIFSVLFSSMGIFILFLVY